MDGNPWLVESLQDFSFLKCPECTFDTQEEGTFEDHATENHPLSFVLFGKTVKEEIHDPLFQDQKPDIIENTIVDSKTKIKELNEKFFESIQTGNVGNGRTFGPGPPISIANINVLEPLPKGDLKEFMPFSENNPFLTISPVVSVFVKEETAEDDKSVHERKKLALTATDCEICGASFKRHDQLKGHVLKVHKETEFYDGRDFKCSICDRAFTSEDGLRRHIKTVHEGKKPHKCLICPMSFATKYRVEIHTKTIHETDNPYKCTLCKSSYKAEMNLKRHITTVHEGKNQFACFNCGDSFVLRKELDAHMEFAHDQMYNCSECEMSYGDKANLLDHIKYVHENREKIKPHKCPTCDACFERVKILQEHIDAVHEKKKPHLCSLCGSGFAYTSALKAHIGNVHERKKSDLCSLCGKAFFSTSRMKRHFRIVHEGIKEKREVLSCPHCDAMLKGKKSLKIHIESVHEKKRFKCTICDNTYSQRNNMMRHILTDHKDNNKQK